MNLNQPSDFTANVQRLHKILSWLPWIRRALTGMAQVALIIIIPLIMIPILPSLPPIPEHVPYPPLSAILSIGAVWVMAMVLPEWFEGVVNTHLAQCYRSMSSGVSDGDNPLVKVTEIRTRLATFIRVVAVLKGGVLMAMLFFLFYMHIRTLIVGYYLPEIASPLTAIFCLIMSGVIVMSILEKHTRHLKHSVKQIEIEGGLR